MCNENKEEVREENDKTSEDAPKDKILSKEREDEIYEEIYSGEITTKDLPIDLYINTGKYLTSGVEKGLSNAEKLGLGVKPSPSFFNALKENVFLFSGAKTFQQVSLMSAAILDSNGNVRSFSDFKKDAKVIFGQFNENWIRTEYNQSLSGAQMSSRWEQVIEDVEDFPFLRYIDQHDGRVREEHSELDGVVRPVTDTEFWGKFYPPNGWNCRCNVQRLSETYEDEITELKGVKLPELKPQFDNNVGMSREIFTKEHPYFIVSSENQAALRDNFGLPKDPTDG